MSKFLDHSRARGSTVNAVQRTSTEWASANPVLKSGEVAMSTDIRQFKIGNGTTAWADLEYFSAEPQINESIGDQTLNATDTYVTGSMLVVPPTKLAARCSIRMRGWATKTAAGTAAPAFKVRVGTAGTIADTVRATFNGPAQTAAADSAFFELLAILRNIGTSAVLSGVLRITHDLLDTGFAIRPCPVVIVVSSGFDVSVADLKLGLSIDPGANGVWTMKGIIAELMDT